MGNADYIKTNFAKIDFANNSYLCGRKYTDYACKQKCCNAVLYPFQALKIGQSVKLPEKRESLSKQMFLVIGKFLRKYGKRRVGIPVATFLDGFEGSLADIVNLIMIYFSRERAFPFQIMKVKFDGSTANRLLAHFGQFLIDESYQILSRIMVIAIGQQLVEDVVACYGVFVCRHKICFYYAANIQTNCEIFFRCFIYLLKNPLYATPMLKLGSSLYCSLRKRLAYSALMTIWSVG